VRITVLEAPTLSIGANLAYWTASRSGTSLDATRCTTMTFTETYRHFPGEPPSGAGYQRIPSIDE